MIERIVKRNGTTTGFDVEKIRNAISKAAEAAGEGRERIDAIVDDVVSRLEAEAVSETSVEHVQDIVEDALIDADWTNVAKSYIRYRDERAKKREITDSLMSAVEEITFSGAKESDMQRENANIDADTAMGTMLKYGSETAKRFYEAYVLDPRFSKAHIEGDIHIHDLDFYTLTTTCCQIELRKLFKGGFSTGHGVLREPNSIQSYASLACIAIQANQNDQHGGQSICDFDYAMGDGVAKTYRAAFEKLLGEGLEILCHSENPCERAKAAMAYADETTGRTVRVDTVDEEWEDALYDGLELDGCGSCGQELLDFVYEHAYQDTDRATYQAMEALVHNLNTMHSRAGAQTPFSSINYGMDTSPEGRLAIKNLLLTTEAGLGHGETPIFPVQIFKVKEGVNYNPDDPNYDLFKLAIRCSAKRLFPNFSFIDAPFNLQYYKGTPETEIAYMGCRTRVMGNNYDPEREITPGRGNLSFTSINLPRLAIRADHDVDRFFQMLDEELALVCDQLEERLKIQMKKKVANAPFLMGQGVWIDSEKLDYNDEQGDILKHGTLTAGFIGLAETLVALTGHHHGESIEAQKLGLKIIGHMREYMDDMSTKKGLNFSLIATPAEGLSGRFVKLDKKRYGEIPGVTDRDYYTNSFHVPVYYPISAAKKIAIEAPYHAFTNGGHISYIELDGDPTQNLEAFESVIRYMKEQGIGYGSINHPVDRDPVCGYNGIIGDVCPKCGRVETEDQPFERIRRITGYLVGTLDRFNDAKRAEEHDRVKHSL